jgi:hypothetical protein
MQSLDHIYFSYPNKQYISSKHTNEFRGFGVLGYIDLKAVGEVTQTIEDAILKSHQEINSRIF